MTVAEFLAWESRQELRYEFDGFQPVAMTGGRIAHDLITFNIRKALDARLAGKSCKPHGANVKILTAGEVVSEETARSDRIEKLREYQATHAGETTGSPPL
jgi:hypothetical protein